MHPTATPLSASSSLRGPFRLALLMLVVTTLTILKGAMTTSTGSGLAYPDYPLSDGQLLPESSYTTIPGFLEHFHRLFAVSAGLLSLSLWLWLHFGRLGDLRVRRWALGGGCLIFAQGLFGGFGVLLKLPTFTSVTHATLAQLTLATFGCIAYQLSDRYRATQPLPTVPTGAGRKLAIIALLSLVVQTVFGAVARHTNSQHALWTHVGNAFVVFVIATIATAFAQGRLGDAPGIKSLVRWLVLLLITQIGLGFVVLGVRNPAGKTKANVEQLGVAFTISMHVVIGALLTVLMAVLAAHVFRATRAPLARPLDAPA